MVIYRKDGKVLWASDTNHIRYHWHPDTSDYYVGKCLNLTNDGFLVIFGANTNNPEDFVFWDGRARLVPDLMFAAAEKYYQGTHPDGQFDTNSPKKHFILCDRKYFIVHHHHPAYSVFLRLTVPRPNIEIQIARIN